jgi:FkbM family methyltransferase
VSRVNSKHLQADVKEHASGQLQERFHQLDRLRESVEYICAALSQMVPHQTQLRSEVVALSNRHGRVEEDLAGVRDAREQTSRHLEEVSKFLHAVNDHVAELSAHMKELSAFQHAINERVAVLDDRSRLFVTSADHGLFLLKSGDLISDRVLERHPWDEHIMAAIAGSLRGRKTLAVDVGAHVGLLTVALARRFQRVLSFEPNAFNYRLLTANVALNRLSNVECINGALYSGCVELSLGKSEQQEIEVPLTPEGDFDGLSATNLGAYTFTPDGTGIFRAMARTLDSYNLEDLAFLKIDVQGADGEVIAGATETIRRCRPVIVFEWEDELSKNFRLSLADARRELESQGYSVEQLKAHNDKQHDFIAVPQTVPSSVTS